MKLHYHLRITDLGNRRSVETRTVYGDPIAALARVINIYVNFGFEVESRSPNRAVINNGLYTRELRIVSGNYQRGQWLLESEPQEATV